MEFYYSTYLMYRIPCWIIKVATAIKKSPFHRFISDRRRHSFPQRRWIIIANYVIKYHHEKMLTTEESYLKDQVVLIEGWFWFIFIKGNKNDKIIKCWNKPKRPFLLSFLAFNRMSFTDSLGSDLRRVREFTSRLMWFQKMLSNSLPFRY